MPQTNRALTRAARARATRTGEKYTAAREAVLAIRELMDCNDWSFAKAEAEYDDPLNQVMCQTCGWTYGMVCPECIPGCGCNNGRCSGWRHREDRAAADDLDEGGGCPECGAGSAGDPYGECVCYE